MIYKIGDKIELNCHKDVFIANVCAGDATYEENFDENGFATVLETLEDGGLLIEEVVADSGDAILFLDELSYVQPAGTDLATLADKLYNEIFDDEFIDELLRKKVIEQKLGFELSVKASIELVLEEEGESL